MPAYEYKVQVSYRRRTINLHGVLQEWGPWSEWKDLTSQQHGPLRPWPSLGGARIAGGRATRTILSAHLLNNGERPPVHEGRYRLFQRPIRDDWEPLDTV